MHRPGRFGFCGGAAELKTDFVSKTSLQFASYQY